MKNEEQKMKIFWRLFLGGVLSLVVFPVSAQQYTGMSGLIHVPSADMDEVGTARVGAHFLNREFTPDMRFNFNGKYHTVSHYLSITPFKWIEIGYTCTLQKGLKNEGKDGCTDVGFYYKDRYFSLKIQPIRESQWYPSVVIGTNDPITYGNNKEDLSERGKNQIFGNYYLATSKHLDLKGHCIGFHLAYRKWKHDYNRQWNGLVGGITYQPSFQKNLRLITEYTGEDVNIGFDWKLWKHLLIQSSLQNGKYFSGGVCFCVNLL